jgi:hypothetical protein
MRTLSSSHHQPKKPVKWNRTSTPVCPAACGTGTSKCDGPRTESEPCDHTGIQVAPLSMLTSTVPVWLGKPR